MRLLDCVIVRDLKGCGDIAMTHILEETALTSVVCENTSVERLLEFVTGNCKISTIITVGKVEDPETINKLHSLNIKCLEWSEVMTMGRLLDDSVLSKPEPSDTAVICYTSDISTYFDLQESILFALHLKRHVHGISRRAQVRNTSNYTRHEDRPYAVRHMSNYTRQEDRPYADGREARMWHIYMGDVNVRFSFYKSTLLSILEGRNVRTVYDVACANGIDSVMLVEEGYDVTSSDVETNMVAAAVKEKDRRSGDDVRFGKWNIGWGDWVDLVDGATVVHPEGGYDAIICIGNSFTMLPDFEGENKTHIKALTNFRDLLRPGGVLIIDHRNFDCVITHKTLPPAAFSSIYYNSPRIYNIKNHLIEKDGELTGLLLQADFDVSGTELERDSDVILQERDGVMVPTLKLNDIPFYLHTLKGFGALLERVFGEGVEHRVLPDFKEDVGDDFVPNYWVHVVVKQALHPFTILSLSLLTHIIIPAGTTGKPKGAILTHANIVSCMKMQWRLLWKFQGTFNKDEVYLKYLSEHWSARELLWSEHWPDIKYYTDLATVISYLPLAHVYGFVAECIVLFVGGKIGYYRGDTKLLLEDIMELKPTVFPAVPRVLNKVYDKVMAQLDAKPSVVKQAFNYGVGCKVAEVEQGIIRNNSVWDSLFFKKIQDKLGGRVKVIISGSAPMQDHVIQWFRAVLGTNILEAYGQTETSASSSCYLFGDTLPGHVGIPGPEWEIKLVDVPEMGYFVRDNMGEVCVKGPGVFQGYYKNKEKTDEALKDGWLYSGDIGTWIQGGRLKLIDRKKNIFKLSQGEYIAPEKLELIYERSPYVAQVFIYGDIYKSCVVGLVVLDNEAIAAATLPAQFSGTPISSLHTSPEFTEFILASLVVVGESELNSLEMVRCPNMVLCVSRDAHIWQVLFCSNKASVVYVSRDVSYITPTALFLDQYHPRGRREI
eukprot:sb/3461748/